MDITTVSFFAGDKFASERMVISALLPMLFHYYFRIMVLMERNKSVPLRHHLG